MRTFILVLLFGAALVILDAAAFNGRYLKITWQAIDEQNQDVISALSHQIKKSAITIDGFNR